MMSLSFKVPEQKTKIYVIGSGLSCNQFDFNSIDYETSIIITMNAAIALVEKVDFYMMGDWLALRKCLNNNYKGAKIICRHELGKCNLEYAQDDEKEFDSTIINDHIALLHKINTNLLMHHPVFMLHDFPLEIFEQENKAQYCLDNWIIPTYSLSGAAAMALSFLIQQTNPCIKEINYVGIDSIHLFEDGRQQFTYTEKLKNYTLKFRQDWAMPDKNVRNFAQKLDIYPMQVFCLFLLTSLSEDFYNCLNSHSYMDLKRVPFDKILYLRNDVVDHIVSNDKKTLKKYPFVSNAVGIYNKEFKFMTIGERL